MAYISLVLIGQDGTYLIEPLLFAVAGGTATDVTAAITNFSLVTGASILVKVGTVNANATLNVNNTGAKNIRIDGANIKTGILTSNNIYMFTYDGTYWNVMGGVSTKNVMMATTAEWSALVNYTVPEKTIIVYTDHSSYVDSNGNTITVPGIKISDGLAYVNSLPFIGDDIAANLAAHIANTNIHITSTERTFWNNKLNCDINGERLIFNRS